MNDKRKVLDKAIACAVKWHEGQRDKNDENYILHPIRVMTKVASIDAKIVAILHDVFEDTHCTIEEIRKFIDDEMLIDAINLLTRDRGKTYFEYIEKIKESDLAIEVKLADLNDNLSREGAPKELQLRYVKAINILKDGTKFNSHRY